MKHFQTINQFYMLKKSFLFFVIMFPALLFGQNPNIVINNGGNVSLTLPTNSFQKTGSYTLLNGLSGTPDFGWQQVSGPNSSVITNSSSLTPTISGLIQGEYMFQFNVVITTSSGVVHWNQAYFTVTVTVNPVPSNNGAWSITAGTTNHLYSTNNGAVLIGKQNLPSGLPVNTKLVVDGNIQARKITVNQDTWADYVFDKNYKLPKLSELEKYILENKHLPEIPSTGQIQKQGLDLGSTQEALLKKIEELTLYMIEQNKKSEQQLAIIRAQQASLKSLKRKVNQLQKNMRK
jgi:hypothetical protein